MNGRTVASIRQQLDLTQEELADILRVSVPLLFAWECDLKAVPANIADILERFSAHGLAFFGKRS